MAKTKKPCPGCGEPQPWFRDADKVCGHCQKLIEDGKNARAQAKVGKQAVRMPFAPHGLPYIHHADKKGGEIQRVFVELARSLGPLVQGTEEGVKSVPLVEGMEGSSYASGDKYVSVLRGTPALLNQLYQLIVKACETAHTGGRRQGEDLIGSLAAGRLSLEELNRRSIGSDD